jgi:hypothetical protein
MRYSKNIVQGTELMKFYNALVQFELHEWMAIGVQTVALFLAGRGLRTRLQTSWSTIDLVRIG